MQNKYLPTLPYLTPERSKKFFGIILTFCALSFFGLFAIKPTVATILKLQKELSDSQFVFGQLEIKIKNLTELRKQYFNLQGDLPIVTNAITIQPDTHLLFAQIQSIAQTSNIAIKKLQNSEVEIFKNNKNIDKNYYSYSFTIAGSGSFENILRFVQILTDMERIVNIETFSINNIADQENGSLGFDIQGIAFFKDNL
ncbi:MAG: type 4a pilus biogenesis protein PilO [Candidatus Levybacteria bacterium]|nr:type 4a pilus biogenesis protein PilO [Candidatus Levybacteria bacterium]MDZ4227958.1 type 4a pilus biogenesis protein PilO [Candidatus Levybacteria bacterium]